MAEVSSPVEAIEKIHYSYEQVHAMSLDLSRMILRSTLQREEVFDYILTLPIGGLYPANIVARELGFKAPDFLIFAASSYKKGKEERLKDFEIGQTPDPAIIRGSNFLIIDEVCDTGHSLRLVDGWLKDYGANLTRYGVLNYKESKSETGFVPDWYVAETGKWIVYPWEENERNGLNLPSPVTARAIAAQALQQKN